MGVGVPTGIRGGSPKGCDRACPGSGSNASRAGEGGGHSLFLPGLAGRREQHARPLSGAARQSVFCACCVREPAGGAACRPEHGGFWSFVVLVHMGRRNPLAFAEKRLLQRATPTSAKPWTEQECGGGRPPMRASGSTAEGAGPRGKRLSGRPEQSGRRDSRERPARNSPARAS